MPRHFRLRERVEDAEARVHDPCVDARERMACYTGPGRLAASQVLRREGAVFEKTANARRTRVILDCGGLQRPATICSSSGSGAVTEAKEGECRFSGVRAGRQRRSTKAVHPREVDWTLWPWWRELQPGKPQRVEQPPPIAQVAEDPADRRGGELDQGGRDHDAVVQAALRLPQDVDDLELTTTGYELAAQGLEVGDRAYGCRLPI